MLAAAGYPGSPRAGDVIGDLGAASSMEGVEISAAGVGRDPEGRLVTAGGRVLGVTGMGASLLEARSRAYAAVARMAWEGAQYRSDIALEAAAGAGVRS